MDESKVLEIALKNCKTLERNIYDSIKLVRRLNIRYNSDWLLKNYKNYMNNIWTQYRCMSPEKPPLPPAPKLTEKQRSLSALARPTSSKSHNLVVGARSSLELCGNNRRINYKFIKIKRSMEALILHIQRAIEIGNRQRNYVHVSATGRDSRTRVCCH